MLVVVDVPGDTDVTEGSFVNPEQLAAIEESGVVFVSAGAGTGKTTVLVERYVKAVVERGLSVDSILVITYTERAAGELKARIRERLRELGRRELAREVDRAWISTIHGFCSRLLRGRPFEAGLDPRFRILDESQARVLAAEAFREALAEFCAGRDPARLGLLAGYGAEGLRTMLIGVFERLRSAGRPLELTAGTAPELTPVLEALGEAAGVLLDAEGQLGDYASRVAGYAEEAEPDRLRALPEVPDPMPGTESETAVLAEAVEAAREVALELVAARDRELLEVLLRAFDVAYRRAKDRESAVDFEDLQLRARDLLQRSDAVREQARMRFRSIMVDEFQDTNRLQCELVDLIAGDGVGHAPELFFVGDEFQSIYRFRHADVDVFRERRARSGGVLALTRNYRSRPEVLGVVNHLFSSEFGTGFEPLQAGGRFPDPTFGPPVELLVTDRKSYGTRRWRRAEAEHVARRIAGLVAAGECTPGEVVLLFAAGTSAEVYEERLRAHGLPTHRATGRGYFGQQQVVDLLAYLRLLHNRYDDEALVTVLASPLVGVSNDALVRLRRAAGKRPLFSGLEREVPGGVSARDRRLFEAFRQRYDRLARASSALGLERLCERIVTEHDYDLAVLSTWDGKRRYANLRKLARLARSYEELRGPDVEGFVRFVRDQEQAGVREVEAVAEEEGTEAVRLLTIHSAKGLEFRVVVVCDAGRTGGRSQPDEILCLPDGRFGFKVVDPASGRRVGVFDYENVREAEQAADEQESRRLYYVAMTRAVDRLIISGSVDLSRRDAARSPLGWMLESLAVDLDVDHPLELDAGGTPVLLRVDRAEDEVATVTEAPAEQLELFPGAEPGAVGPAFELAPLAPVPTPPAFELRRLSFSALALYERCSYRFYAERVAGLAAEETPGRPDGEAGLSATELGDAVHQLLELDEVDVSALLDRRFPHATDADRERAESLTRAWRASELCRTVASSERTVRERPFAFEQDAVLLHGRFDLLAELDDRTVVVDYKTNRLDGTAPADVVEQGYGLQRLIYALAVLRAGAETVEVAFVFLERPAEPVRMRFERADEPELSAGLSAAITAIREGRFVPTPGDLACAGCPVLDRVCAGPRLGGLQAATHGLSVAVSG
ncbi:MAG: UvrD-helicase domain-containing protein [Gaiellales bacterium]